MKNRNAKPSGLRRAALASLAALAIGAPCCGTSIAMSSVRAMRAHNRRILFDTM